MDMTPQEYQEYVTKKAKKSPILKDTLLAFLIGGAICVLGQGITELWTAAGLDKEAAGTATSVSLVFLSVLLTGLVNAQVVRTADMMDIVCIVFVRGKEPSQEMIELAQERNKFGGDFRKFQLGIYVYLRCGLSWLYVFCHILLKSLCKFLDVLFFER